MRVSTSIFLLSLALALPSAAEEVSLKDGTKIVGRMTGISADKIEIQTAYGKMQLKRTDIVSINFPENGATADSTSSAAPSTPANPEVPKIEESLNGVQYVNKTAKFSLTLPADWMIRPDMRRTPDTLAALTSRDKTRFLLVVQEEYPGSLDSYKELTLLTARKSLGNFEDLAESQVTIDGKPALVVFYRGVLQKNGNLPIEFVSAIIPSGTTYTKITAWCIEPLFRDMQASFERTLNSYRSSAGPATASRR